MKIKRAAALILVLFLTVVSASAETAPRGAFGELAQDKYPDEQLAILDGIAELVSASLTTEDGMVIEISQGYYDGDRVVIAYRISANTDLIVLHEGAPEEGTEWDQVVEDWIPGDLNPTGYPDVDKEYEWLNGKGQRWLEFPYCGIRENLILEDGTQLDFMAGTEMKLPDGTIVGWRQCLVPQEKAEQNMTFRLPVFYGRATKFQDYATFMESFGHEYTAGISFTLCRMGKKIPDGE